MFRVIRSASKCQLKINPKPAGAAPCLLRDDSAAPCRCSTSSSGPQSPSSVAQPSRLCHVWATGQQGSAGLRRGGTRCSPSGLSDVQELASAAQRLFIPMSTTILSTKAVDSLSRLVAKRAAASLFVRECCRVFDVKDKDELQDLLAALILSECVYKKLEMPSHELGAKVAEFLADFPPELVHLEAIQLSLPDLPQNYLVAVGGRSVYVAFMGTKQARDITTDLSFSHEAVWAAEEAAAAAAAAAPEVPSAHRGFLARAKAVPLQQLQALAAGSGRRLVLCGHSLGGAVAKLVGLRLLRMSPEWPPPDLRVVCFATPAVGNDALASLVEEAGWGSFFSTYVLPEDQLMRMLRFTQAASGRTGSPGSSRAPSPGGTSTLLQQQRRPPPQRSGSGSSLGGVPAVLHGVRAVSGVLRRPFARESAKQQLRRELSAEEASTASLESAAMDLDAPPAAATATAAAAAFTNSSAAVAARSTAAGTAARADGNNNDAGAGASAARLASISRRLWGRARQQQQQQQQQQPVAVRPLDAGPGQPAGSSSSGSALPVPHQAAASSDAAAAAAGVAEPTPSIVEPVVEQEQQQQQGSSSLGAMLTLQQRWLGYQLQQVGRAALAPLTTAQRAAGIFHPFGQYCFIASSGVQPLQSTAPDVASGSQLSPEAAAFQEANPGPFNFHRMVAYRTRCLNLVTYVARDLAQQGLQLPSAVARASQLTATSGSAANSPAAAAAAAAAAASGTYTVGGGSGSELQPVRVGGVLPRLRVHRVLAMPPLQAPSLLLPAAAAAFSDAALGSSASSSSSSSSLDGWGRASAAGDSPAAAAAGVQQVARRGPLAFLPGSRSSRALEPTVPLLLHVRGCNLHLCRYAGLVAFGEEYRPVDLSSSPSSSSSSVQPSAAVQHDHSLPGDGDSSSSRFAPLSMLQPVLARLKQAAVAAAKVAEGPRPRWRVPADAAEELSLRVLLPASAVERLTASAMSASSLGRPADSTLSAAAAAAAVDGGGSSGAELLLLLKSDFEVVSVSVQVQPHCVGVVGSSAAAAALLSNLLSQSSLLQQQYQASVAAASAAATAAGAPAAAGGNSASASAAAAAAAAAAGGMGGRVAANLQRWMPQPQKWLEQQQPQQPQQPQPKPQPQQLQQPAVQKLRAAATVAAAASANAAAARLALLSRQLLGVRRGLGSVVSDDKPIPKRLRTAAAAVGSSAASSLSSYEEAAAPAATAAPPAAPAAAASGAYVPVGLMQQAGGGSGNASTTAVDSAAAAAAGKAAGSSRPEHTATVGAGFERQQQTAAKAAAGSFRPGAHSGSSSGGGLRGVMYRSLPLPAQWLPLLPLPAPPVAAAGTAAKHGTPAAGTAAAGPSLLRVLNRATKQLQQQARMQQQQQPGWPGSSGSSSSSPGLAGLLPWILQQPSHKVAAVAADAAATVARGSSSSRRSTQGSKRRNGTTFSSSSRTKLQAQSPKAGTGSSSRAGHGGSPMAATAAVPAQPSTHSHSSSSPVAAAVAATGVGAGQAWDVLLLAVTWDDDFLMLLRHRSALAALAAAAAAAGVQLVPVLLLEGEESLLSPVSNSAMRAISQPHGLLRQLSWPGRVAESEKQGSTREEGGAGVSVGSSNSNRAPAAAVAAAGAATSGLLRLGDAADQLAAALKLRNVDVFHLPVRGLLGSSSSSSSSSHVVAGLQQLPQHASSAAGAGMLASVGGLEEQQQLLLALQGLEGHVCRLLQQQVAAGPGGRAAAVGVALPLSRL